MRSARRCLGRVQFGFIHQLDSNRGTATFLDTSRATFRWRLVVLTHPKPLKSLGIEENPRAGWAGLILALAGC